MLCLIFIKLYCVSLSRWFKVANKRKYVIKCLMKAKEPTDFHSLPPHPFQRPWDMEACKVTWKWAYRWFLSQLTLFSTNSFTHLTSDPAWCSVADEVLPNNYSASTDSILGGIIDTGVTRKVLTSWVVTTILCYQPWMQHVWSTLVLLRPGRKVMQIQALKADTD